MLFQPQDTVKWCRVPSVPKPAFSWGLNCMKINTKTIFKNEEEPEYRDGEDAIPLPGSADLDGSRWEWKAAGCTGWKRSRG